MEALIRVLDAILRKFGCVDCGGYSGIMLACDDDKLRCYNCAVLKYCAETYERLEQEFSQMK